MELGELGEALAARFLEGHGLVVVGSNVAIAGGEIDLVAMDGSCRVVAEVRTTVSSSDPIDAIDGAKRERVARLARIAGADRTDLVGIRVGTEGIDVHWVPGGA